MSSPRFGSLMHCEVCNKEISSKAEVCPNCGQRYKMHPVVSFQILLLILSVIFIIATLSNN
jgi:hypothetical protein